MFFGLSLVNEFLYHFRRWGSNLSTGYIAQPTGDVPVDWKPEIAFATNNRSCQIENNKSTKIDFVNKL